MALLGRADISISLFAQLAALGDAGGGASGRLDFKESMASGTAASQADGLFYDVRTLGNGAAEDLDLEAVLDVNGIALAAVEVVAFGISCAAANTDAIDLKPSAANGWTSLLQAGSVLSLAAGSVLALGSTADGAYAVAGANKSINLENKAAGATASYTIWVLTRSA